MPKVSKDAKRVAKLMSKEYKLMAARHGIIEDRRRIRKLEKIYRDAMDRHLKERKP